MHLLIEVAMWLSMAKLRGVIERAERAWRGVMRILAPAMRLRRVGQTQDHIACAFIYTLNTSCCGEEHALPICKHRPLEHRPLLPQGAQLALEPGQLVVDAS